MASFKAQYAELLKREGNYHDGTIGGAARWERLSHSVM